ncbi:MAG TPA: calcium-binding protein, partial [Allosphingosinicella sp.]|nr:calcium-binding protein [Allosphingosinicella sp.]
AGIAHVEDLILTGTADLSGTGNQVQNRITGNSGNNLLRGLDGGDHLEGGAGNDELRGGNGNDVLNGGSGNDVLIGGEGGDGFQFDNFSVDTMLDFVSGNVILLDAATFDQIGESSTNPDRILLEDAFVRGSAAQDAEDRIIHNPDTGEIFYDPDGSGSAAAILFAQVDPDTQLFSSQFRMFG